MAEAPIRLLIVDEKGDIVDGDHVIAICAGDMRDRGVLVGTTGRAGNVLKIRPPLPFDGTDAELTVAALDDVLRDLSAN